MKIFANKYLKILAIYVLCTQNSLAANYTIAEERNQTPSEPIGEYTLATPFYAGLFTNVSPEIVHNSCTRVNYDVYLGLLNLSPKETLELISTNERFEQSRFYNPEVNIVNTPEEIDFRNKLFTNKTFLDFYGFCNVFIDNRTFTVSEPDCKKYLSDVCNLLGNYRFIRNRFVLLWERISNIEDLNEFNKDRYTFYNRENSASIIHQIYEEVNGGKKFQPITDYPAFKEKVIKAVAIKQLHDGYLFTPKDEVCQYFREECRLFTKHNNPKLMLEFFKEKQLENNQKQIN